VKKGFRQRPKKVELAEERLPIQLATAENIANANNALIAAEERYVAAKTALHQVVVSVFTERGIKNAQLVKVEGGSSPALVVKVLERAKKK
jgi:hypothetical protein